MNDAREAESEHQPYVRAPWPLVAAALLAVLAVALAIGLFANRSLRQQAQLPPTPLAVVAPSATPLPTVSVGPTAVVLATSTAIPTSTPTVSATPQLPASTTRPTSAPTVDPQLADAIDQAYQQYWYVRAEALLDLDTTRLPDAMAGEHLASIEKFIDQLRTEGRSIQTDVEHRYILLEASNTEALVSDSYVDNSVYVDPTSHAVLSQPSGGTLKEQYRMLKTDGTWRVVSLVRSP